MHILLVEDDAAIASSVVDGLQAAGFTVTTVTTGAAALAQVAEGGVDLVLLDLGLPDTDGRHVCRAIRDRGHTPVIMVTARGDESDRVVGLELGADDYVTKPFGLRELVARIRAVARRTELAGGQAGGGAAEHHRLEVGSLVVDTRARRVYVGEREVVLTAKEFDVLAYLAADPGAAHSRVDILEHVWDTNWFGPTKTVDAHVAAVRKKLGDPRWIEAVRGVGFRLEPVV